MAYERTPRPDMVVDRILNNQYERNVQGRENEEIKRTYYEYKTPSSYQSLSGKALTPVGRKADLQGMSVPPVRIASRPTNITQGPAGTMKNNITSQTVTNDYLSENPRWLNLFGKSNNPISNNEY